MTRALSIGGRLLSAIPVLLIVVVGTFLLLEAAPGRCRRRLSVSIGGDAGLIAELRAAWGLDGTVGGRLATYLWSLLRLDLGQSVTFSRPVGTVILERLPNTLLLMGSATALSFGLGSLLGLVGRRKARLVARPRALHRLAGALCRAELLAGAGACRHLRGATALAAAVGIETLASGKTGLDRAADIARHLVLPVAALGFIYLALYLRLMRAGMAEVWRMDFVLALKARGLSRQRIVIAHVARNALLPLVTMLGLQSAAMLGGSVVIESVFSIPGLGRLAQEAVAARDTPLLLGIILVSAVWSSSSTSLVDIAYAVLDPRVGAARRRRDDPPAARLAGGRRRLRPAGAAGADRRCSAPLLFPRDPLSIAGPPLLRPFDDAALPLGTDRLGRDVLAGIVSRRAHLARRRPRLRRGGHRHRLGRGYGGRLRRRAGG